MKQSTNIDFLGFIPPWSPEYQNGLLLLLFKVSFLHTIKKLPSTISTYELDSNKEVDSETFLLFIQLRMSAYVENTAKLLSLE